MTGKFLQEEGVFGPWNQEKNILNQLQPAHPD